MENYPYNSYPESGNSSPRSRDIDFENSPPWEDQPQNYRAKFMCSYGGKIHPRPHDNQLSYIGGETKILAVERNIKFSSMISKLSTLCGGDAEVSFKYQLPGEDLDALISVTNDDDLEHMMHEYDRLYKGSVKPARMRLFIFPATGSGGNFGNEGARSERERFVEALNSGPTPGGGEKTTAIPPNNVDFLFGLEKGMAPPLPVKIRDPVVEQVALPPPPVPEVVGSDNGFNPVEIQRQLHELQRLQIRDQEHAAVYRRKTEDPVSSVPYTGEYYAHKLPEKAPPMTVPVTLQQQHAPPTAGFWPDKQISTGGFPATVTTTPGPPPQLEHPVYMIQAPGPGQVPTTVYHAAPQVPAPAPTSATPQMVRPVTGQPGQGYYTNVQRMPPPEVYREQQPVYNMMPQQPPPHTQQHPPISAMSQQVVRPTSGGVSDSGAYAHVAGYDRQVYYTAPGAVMMPPQYQGVGVAVSGEMRGSAEAKVVNKASQGSV